MTSHMIKRAAMFARAEGAKQCHASIALAMNERNFEGLKKHLGHRVVYVSQKGNERPAEVKGAVRVINEVKSDIEMLDTGSRPLFNFSNVVVADQGVLDEEGVVLKSQLFVFTTPSSGFPGALIRAGNVHDEYEYSHSTDGWHLVSRHLQAALVLGSFAAVHAADETHTQPWLYGEVDTRGPSNWDTATSNPVCKTGTEQSPINIQGVTADSGLKPLEMHYTAALGFNLINNQHSVEVVPTNNDGNYLLDPNNGNKRYNLAQMHFHSPSEHGIGGGLYDLELHMVHSLADTTDTNEKFQNLVVGTLFTAGSAPNENFGFFDRLPTVPMSGFDNYANASAEYAYRMSTETTNFDFAGLLASRRFYTYDGSLTTPPCTEGVKWYVRQEVGVVSTAQLTAFRNAMMFTQELVVADNLGWKPSTFQYFGNNRPMQLLNTRNVRSFEDSASNNDDDDEDRNIAIAALVIGCVAVLLACVALAVGGASGGGGGKGTVPAVNEPVAEN